MSKYSDDRRKRWAKLLVEESGGSTAMHLRITELLPTLIDLSDALFSEANAKAAARKCSDWPSAPELRALLVAPGTSPSFAQKRLAPLPGWLVAKIMANVGNQPSPMLQAWLDAHDTEVTQ